MTPDYYNTIEKEALAEFKDRGSRFLAYAFPIFSVEGFKIRLQQIKEEHPKAVHHCFAYRVGTDGNNFRSSDDREPSGSAGRPILGQIDSKQLTNVAVIVVRYFGGTLLGVPGLINAYKTSAALALQTTPAVQKAIEINYRIQFDYTMMNEVMMLVKKYNCTLLKKEMQLFCVMEIGIPRANLELCLLKLKNIRGAEVNKC
ncbi:MAG: YigZ family protein [Chitinophagaceae bacterium]|nr:MAG: YigZ family protein [Chitinophagaceae bacterium]